MTHYDYITRHNTFFEVTLENDLQGMKARRELLKHKAEAKKKLVDKEAYAR